jgi:hypothetical protein
MQSLLCRILEIVFLILLYGPGGSQALMANIYLFLLSILLKTKILTFNFITMISIICF